MQYIGLDLHAKTFSIAVLDKSGELMWKQTCRTSGETVVELMNTLAGAKKVALEESTLADWAFRLLSPHAQVTVADPRHNHWISRDEKIDDERAACKLAELLRAGLLNPVHHSWSAVAWIDGKTYTAPTAELHILDRVGGGGGFASGFFYGLLSGEEPQDAVNLWWAHGALLTTFPGDTTMATLDQVRAFAEGGSARIQR